MRILHSRFGALVMVVGLIAFSLGAVAPIAAQQQSPVSRSVIAHGVDSFDGDTMMWQVAQSEAGTDLNAAPADMSTGFVYASGEALTLSDSTAGRGDYVRDGAASFHPRGSLQLVVGGTSYTEIALSSDDLGGTYTSNGVQTPDGTYAVELFSGTLSNGDVDSYAPVTEFAYLLHVTSGSVSILDDESSTYERSVGESITITGDIQIRATSDVTFLIASIGLEVTVPPFAVEETGTLTVEQFDCAKGVDPTSDASSCTPVEEPWFVNIHPSGRDDDSVDLNIPEDGVDENGRWTWTEMSAGAWYITPAEVEGTDFQIVVSGATAEEDHYNAEISAGDETVVSIYLVGERPTGNGWLDIARLSCETALPASISLDMPDCIRNLDGAPEFTLMRVNDDSVVFDESSVTLTDDGLYRLPDLPAGTYIISFDVPEDGDLRISGDTTSAGGVLRYTVFISPEGQTIVIYAESRVTSSPEPEATPQE